MNLSGSGTIFLLVLACLFGAIGYRLSENFRRLTGRTPWGMSSILWAFIWFLSLLLGFVLYMIARATTKVDPAARAAPVARPRWPAGPSGTVQTGTALPGRYPSRVPPGDGGFQPPVPDPSAGPPAPAVSPPMWHPDPSGEFEYRWWDGVGWTATVARGGVQQDDPHFDQGNGQS
ncbi:MAG TPA: DUF2510 domain-containing protein [Acidimicrobiales bacterium]|jgi:hypothetical protein|nr:DUF2510 domain-containing protein [Acidimicrobiales bacterium]